MTTSMLVYLNLALLAAASLVYVAYDKDASNIEPRVQHVFIATVPENSTAAARIRSAAYAIETGWKCRVTVMYAPDSPAELARALKRAITLKPDGISMPGNTDEKFILPVVTEAHRQGIPVTFHGSPNPEAQRRFGELGAGVAGMEDVAEGYALAKAAVDRLAIQPGTPVLLAGTEPTVKPDSRLGGSQALLQSLGIQSEYLRVASIDTGAGLTAPDPVLTRRIESETLPGVVFWEAGPVTQITSILVEERVTMSDVRIINLGPPLDDIPTIEARFVRLQPVEQTFLTCYFSLIQLQLTHRYGVQGIEIPIGGA